MVRVTPCVTHVTPGSLLKMSSSLRNRCSTRRVEHTGRPHLALIHVRVSNHASMAFSFSAHFPMLSHELRSQCPEFFKLVGAQQLPDFQARFDSQDEQLPPQVRDFFSQFEVHQEAGDGKWNSIGGCRSRTLLGFARFVPFTRRYRLFCGAPNMGVRGLPRSTVFALAKTAAP